MCVTYVFKSRFGFKLFVHHSENNEHYAKVLLTGCKMTLERYLSHYASCQLCLSVIKSLYSVLHPACHGYECVEMFLCVYDK